MSVWSSSQRHEFLRHPPSQINLLKLNVLILQTDTHLDAISSRLKCLSQICVLNVLLLILCALTFNQQYFFFSKPKPSFRRLGALVNLALSLRKELYLLYNKVQTSQKQESQIRPWQKTDLQSSEEKNMEEERHDDGNILVDVHIIIVYWWWCAGLCCIQKLQNCTLVLQSANGPKAYCKSNLIVS